MRMAVILKSKMADADKIINGFNTFADPYNMGVDFGIFMLSVLVLKILQKSN